MNPACACVTVTYNHIDHGRSGAITEQWTCAVCGSEFIRRPVDVAPASEPVVAPTVGRWEVVSREPNDPPQSAGWEPFAAYDRVSTPPTGARVAWRRWVTS